MLSDPTHQERLGGLEARLRRAHALTPDLLADVIMQACVRFASDRAAAKARLNQFIESGAWVDATLALVELELPRWKLRRIVCEDGEWHCCLSRLPLLPLEFDDVAEASHESLPLAILISFLQARRAAAVSAPATRAVPQVCPAADYAVHCDNFA